MASTSPLRQNQEPHDGHDGDKLATLDQNCRTTSDSGTLESNQRPHQRHDQQPDRRGQDLADEVRLRKGAPPHAADERRQRACSAGPWRNRTAARIAERPATRDGGPPQPGAVEQPAEAGVAPAAADLVVQVGNRRRAWPRENSQRAGPSGCSTRSTTTSSGPSARSIVPTTSWLIFRGFAREPSGSSLSFARRAGSRASSTTNNWWLSAAASPPLRSVRRYCGGDLGLAVIAGGEESHHRAPRRVPPERVLRRGAAAPARGVRPHRAPSAPRPRTARAPSP